MAKYKPCKEEQRLMLTISLQDQIVPVTLEHTISELVEMHRKYLSDGLFQPIFSLHWQVFWMYNLFISVDWMAVLTW